ncbi:aminopeptidase [Bacillaceae bacterium SIJ1]|uniref:aminopeptidase n=1 Tax=Litoribacterium kuwaitense TaxID=1398745 RepID=UPI0013EC7E69|nr:aminopeptidase [Litoribacterium kuwaitense]NGP44827.1 aminopeptidase [Litoribacterium kuwaitense]
MQDFEKKITQYAELAVKTGINIQPEQTLVINASTQSIPFVRQVVEQAYLAGARHVHVDWSDDGLTLTKFQHAPEEALDEFPTWKVRAYEQLAEEGAAFMNIVAPNPELLKDIDSKKVARARKASSKALEKYTDARMNDKVSWTIVATPTPEWAAKVFPNETEEKAIERLWEQIFQVNRLNEDDPVKAWETHNDKLHEKADFLNDAQFEALIYKGPGTDLVLELPKGHRWLSAASTNDNGHSFMPNMPTEEVFTMPKRDGVHGTVTSTKPLHYGGTLIENFSFTFEDGKVVDVKAEKGLDTLKELLDTDEGAKRLGEVALVPHDSPISQSNIIFFNTLFDENASCHIALGTAYPFTIEGGKEMTKDELKEHGANVSMTHVDFMIGSEHLNIDGKKADGTLVPLFRDGNWADDIS